MKEPFYRGVICSKGRGGKHASWKAFKPGLIGEHGATLIGVGNTGDNAIADLAKCARKVAERIRLKGTK